MELIGMLAVLKLKEMWIPQWKIVPAAIVLYLLLYILVKI